MSKVIDMTNQTFGYLTVLSRNGSKDGCAAWLCQCDCGNKVTVKGSELRKGNVTSCGCRKRRQNLSLIGQRVNHLTVIKQTELRTKDGSILWECQCDCGKIINVPTTKLKNKTIKSCGCEGIKQFIERNHNKKIDLTGKTFGELTVLHEVEQRSNDKQVMWLCQCSCGNSTIVRGADLRSGNTKSCGCKANKSYGEAKIQKLLTENNIIFEREKTFNDCRFIDTNHLARFDFYLPQYNTLIEYDGIQHFQEGKGLFDNK